MPMLLRAAGALHLDALSLLLVRWRGAGRAAARAVPDAPVVPPRVAHPLANDLEFFSLTMPAEHLGPAEELDCFGLESEGPPIAVERPW
jgi:hypothetical protein